MIARTRGLLSGETMRARALRGTMITFLAFGGGNVMRLASNLILTRLLFPEAFGLMALVQVVLQGLAMFSDTGTSMSVLQNPRGLEPVFLRTAWSIQIGRGVLLWLATIALAWPVASFYGQPILAWMLPVVGLNALSQGLNSMKLMTANRKLLLGRITLIDLVTQAFSIGAMVVLAFLLDSVWSLVIGSVLGSVFKTILSHVAMPGERDRMGWDRSVSLELFHFGKWIFVSSIAGFLINSADRMVLGKFVDVATLGIYNIGYFLATVPLTLARQIDGRVLVPIFVAAVTDSPAESRRKVRRTRSLLTTTLIGLSLVAAFLGEWAIGFLYEPRYALAGPILVLLALSNIPIILTSSYGSLLLAYGKSLDFTIYSCAFAATQTVLILYGVSQYGLIGALIAPALGTLLNYPLTAWLAVRRGGWDPALDAALAAFGVAGAALALWFNPGAVAAVLASN